MLVVAATRLRPFSESDVGLLAGMRNDVELQETLLAMPRGSSESAVRAWLSRLEADVATLFFVVADRSSDRALGFVQLRNIELTHRRGELGLALVAEARGLGHGSAAIRLLEGHARDVFGLEKTLLYVLGVNLRAQQLYERLGYRRIGVLEAHHYARGAFHDVVMMEKRLGTPCPQTSEH
jgi:RimJ/RimL family protein N-acetyltransferase